MQHPLLIISDISCTIYVKRPETTHEYYPLNKKLPFLSTLGKYTASSAEKAGPSSKDPM